MFLLAAGFCDGLLMAWDPAYSPFLQAPGCKSARLQNITGDRPLLHSTVKSQLQENTTKLDQIVPPSLIREPTVTGCITRSYTALACVGKWASMTVPLLFTFIPYNEMLLVETLLDLASVLFSRHLYQSAGIL